ncbi:MAG: PTS system mannose/fructose/sorbose family transporter subunit IID [Gemmatimonadales bacterium]|jgi:PTS system mannose-specific IID component|nr:PTS system mannose/fructose/sorbose family transporter subunit IID [Gemmatimonadales bacterium]
MISPRWQALWRLMAVQAAWTYERMAGIGVGHAAAPLLRELYRDRPVEERRAAVARSAEYFNSHPYLAGIAVGAVVRAESDGVPGVAISRLRVALSGPLGALGDQLIWAGQVPVLMGLALASVPWLGWRGILGAVIIHNLLRWRLTLWGLDLGLASGAEVGAVLRRTALPRLAAGAQRAAAFVAGLALPIVVAWSVDRSHSGALLVTLGIALAGATLMLAPVTRTRVTGIRYGLCCLGIVLLVIGGLG